MAFFHNYLFVSWKKSIKLMLSMFRVIGCLPHVSHCQMYVPHKLWNKLELTENAYTKCCATTDPDLNPVGFTLEI